MTPPKLTREKRIERFWKKVNKTNTCWLWIGYCDKDGRGRVQFFDRRTIGAPTFSWFLTYGKLPKNSVLHACDVPACVKPAHLFEGTQLDNMMDAFKKGRRKRISDEVCKCIKEQVQAGVNQCFIAGEFNIAQSTVSLIVRGHSGRKSRTLIGE